MNIRSIAEVPGAEYWINEKTGPVATGTSIRSRTLAETDHISSQLMESIGITRVSDVTGLDIVGIPVYHTVRPSAMYGLNTVTSGKGTTRESARLSGVMEAIERRWCEPDIDGLIYASYEELTQDGVEVLDPRRLSPRRDHTWSTNSKITWCASRDLVTDMVMYVPALAVFTPFSHETGLFSSNTIGLAIGNSPTEALLHALLEVIEHDATAFGETLHQGHRIIIDSLPDQAAELANRITSAGLELTVLAYQTEIGIPSFYAAIEDPYRFDGMLFNGGAGCHLDPEIAVTRALTEAAQSRLNVIGGAREDFARQAYRRESKYDEIRATYHSWRAEFTSCEWSIAQTHESVDLLHNLDRVLEALGRAEVDAICAVELAPPHYPFSVTKVVVPRLEVHHQDKKRIGVRLNRAMLVTSHPSGREIYA